MLFALHAAQRKRRRWRGRCSHSTAHRRLLRLRQLCPASSCLRACQRCGTLQRRRCCGHPAWQRLPWPNSSSKAGSSSRSAASAPNQALIWLPAGGRPPAVMRAPRHPPGQRVTSGCHRLRALGVRATLCPSPARQRPPPLLRPRPWTPTCLGATPGAATATTSPAGGCWTRGWTPRAPCSCLMPTACSPRTPACGGPWACTGRGRGCTTCAASRRVRCGHGPARRNPTACQSLERALSTLPGWLHGWQPCVC
jgi:hypothetical protein